MILYEKLAEIEHQRWADWQRYVHSICQKNSDGTLTIPAWAVDNWNRQIDTSYANLSEKEKDADRKEVKRYWNLIESCIPEEIAKPDKNDICISCKRHIDICNCDLNYTWNDCIAEMKNKML